MQVQSPADLRRENQATAVSQLHTKGFSVGHVVSLPHFVILSHNGKEVGEDQQHLSGGFLDVRQLPNRGNQRMPGKEDIPQGIPFLAEVSLGTSDEQAASIKGEGS